MIEIMCGYRLGCLYFEGIVLFNIGILGEIGGKSVEWVVYVFVLG